MCTLCSFITGRKKLELQGVQREKYQLHKLYYLAENKNKNYTLDMNAGEMELQKKYL